MGTPKLDVWGALASVATAVNDIVPWHVGPLSHHEPQPFVVGRGEWGPPVATKIEIDWKFYSFVLIVIDFAADDPTPRYYEAPILRDTKGAAL